MGLVLLVQRVIAVVVATVAVHSMFVGRFEYHPLVLGALVALVVVTYVLLMRRPTRVFSALPDLDMAEFPRLAAWVSEISTEYKLNLVVKDGTVAESDSSGQLLGEALVGWRRAYVGVNLAEHPVAKIGDYSLQHTLAHELVHVIRRHGNESRFLPFTLLASIGALVATMAAAVAITVLPEPNMVSQTLAMVLGYYSVGAGLLVAKPRMISRYLVALDEDEEREADLSAIALMGTDAAFNAEMRIILAYKGSTIEPFFERAYGGKYASYAERLAWITGQKGWLDPHSEQWDSVRRTRALLGKATELGELAAVSV